MNEDSEILNLRLKTGEDIEVTRCTCHTCGNIWWIANHIEYIPDYCCYCGVKFSKKTHTP